MQTLRRISLAALIGFFVLFALPPLATDSPFATNPPLATDSRAFAQEEVAPSHDPQLVVFSIPGFQWSDLDPQKTPTLWHLAETSAIANMNAPYNDLYEQILDEPGIDLRILGDTVLGDTPTLAFYDQQLATLLAELDEDQPFAVVSAPAVADQGASRDLVPAIFHGASLQGFASSVSTQRTGLVIGDDLWKLSRQLRESSGELSVSSSISTVISSHPTEKDLSARMAQLEQENTRIVSIIENKALIGLVFLALILVAFVLSLPLLLIGQSKKKGARGVLIPLVRVLWILVLSGPPATFLMFIVLPQQADALQLMLICFAWVIGLALVALIVGQRTTWVNSLFSLLFCSIAVVVIGQLFGGPLDLPGYLTYDITDGSRYYGMGNEHAALLFGAWFAAAGLLINRFPTARGMKSFKRWGFLLGSALLLFLTASPWLGASFGPLIWGTFGAVLLCWLFNGRRLRWWFLLIILVASAGLAIALLFADLQLNTFSHVSDYRSALGQGDFFGMLLGIMENAWRISLGNMTRFMPIPVILFVLLLMAFLVILRLFKPGAYREFWRRNPAFSAVYLVGFLIALITFFLEDSGLSTPAFFLVYPIAAFVWLVCDMHRWHLRALNKSADPFTVQQLMQRALEGEAPPHEQESSSREQKTATRGQESSQHEQKTAARAAREDAQSAEERCD